LARASRGWRRKRGREIENRRRTAEILDQSLSGKKGVLVAKSLAKMAYRNQRGVGKNKKNHPPTSFA